jgi:hypothetical protein
MTKQFGWLQDICNQSFFSSITCAILQTSEFVSHWIFEKVASKDVAWITTELARRFGVATNQNRCQARR